MSVISLPQAFNEEKLYVDLPPIFGRSLFLTCEGFNFAATAAELQARGTSARRVFLAAKLPGRDGPDRPFNSLKGTLT